MLFVPPSIPHMVPEAEASHGGMPSYSTAILPADWGAAGMANGWDFRGVPLATDASFVIQLHPPAGIYSFASGQLPGNNPSDYGIHAHHVWIDKDTPDEIFSWWDHESGTCITGSNFEWNGSDVSNGYESTCSNTISVTNPETDVYLLQVNAQYLTEGEHTFKWDSVFFVPSRTLGGGANLFLIGEDQPVPDVEDPVITVPQVTLDQWGNKVIELTMTDMTNFPTASWSVSATDNVGVTNGPACWNSALHGTANPVWNSTTQSYDLTLVTNPSGNQFPIGSTAISCAASDAAGNNASYGFTVKVTHDDPTGLVQYVDKPNSFGNTPDSTTKIFYSANSAQGLHLLKPIADLLTESNTQGMLARQAEWTLLGGAITIKDDTIQSWNPGGSFYARMSGDGYDREIAKPLATMLTDSNMAGMLERNNPDRSWTVGDNTITISEDSGNFAAMVKICYPSGGGTGCGEHHLLKPFADMLTSSNMNEAMYDRENMRLLDAGGPAAPAPESSGTPTDLYVASNAHITDHYFSDPSNSDEYETLGCFGVFDYSVGKMCLNFHRDVTLNSLTLGDYGGIKSTIISTGPASSVKVQYRIYDFNGDEVEVPAAGMFTYPNGTAGRLANWATSVAVPYTNQIETSYNFDPGDARNAYHSFNITSDFVPGHYTITMNVDPENIVPETNESNNNYWGYFDVIDTTPPVVTVPPNQYLTSTPGEWMDSTFFNFSPYITATDNVGIVGGWNNGGIVLCSYSPSAQNGDGTYNFPSGTDARGIEGASFPVGITAVTCSASDAAGNVGTASYTVIVTPEGASDATPPVVTIGSLLANGITISATDSSGAFLYWVGSVDSDGITRQDTGGAYSLIGRMSQITATDNVGINTTLGNIHTYYGNSSTPNGITCDNPLLWTNDNSVKQKFPIGTTTITCTATDTAGNVGTASFTVTVEGDDTTPPVISLAFPTNPTITTTNSTGYQPVVTVAPYSGAPAVENDWQGTPTLSHNLTYRIDPTDTSVSLSSGGEIWFEVSVTDNVDLKKGPNCIPGPGITFFPIGDTVVTCTAEDAAGNEATTSFTVTVVLEGAAAGEEIVIPSWIKNNAGWWADGSIDDGTFVAGLQWLITNGIMHIPETEQGAGSDSVIPGWIKQVAGWWADDQIDDRNFVGGLQWLITNGIMVIG